MVNTIEDLRETLFRTLSALSDPKNPMDCYRAKTIGEVAQVIVNSAKVECDHMKITGANGTGFIPERNKLGEPRLIKGSAASGSK